MNSHRLKARASLLAVVCLALGIWGCSGEKGEPAATPSPTATPESTPTETASPVPTESPASPLEATAGSSSAAAAREAGSRGSGSAGSAGSGSGSVEPPAAAAPSSPQQAEPPPPPPRRYTLRPGTQLTVYTSRELSSKTNQVGDTFVGSLANAIVDNDWVIARKGAQVEGVITNVDEGGRVKGVASIAVQLKRLQLADGRTVAIDTTTYVRNAPKSTKKDAAKIGIGAGVGAAIGAIAGGGKGAAIGAGVGGGAGTGVVMATRGEPAVIPSEAALSFRVTSPVTITQQR